MRCWSALFGALGLTLGLGLGAPAWADELPSDSGEKTDTSDTACDEDDEDCPEEEDKGCFGGGKAALSIGLLMVYGLRKRT